MKFGGSSVATATNISRVLDIVESACRKDKVILVSSAIKGCTDSLIAAAGSGNASGRKAILEGLLEQHLEIAKRLFTGEEREQAVLELQSVFEEIFTLPTPLEAYGEILSTKILARKLACDGFKTVWLDSRSLIKVGASGAVSTEITYSRISDAVLGGGEDVEVFIAPGFIASDSEGNTTTLGRGGSDYSAALYAAAVKADSLQIWTDVPGIMTANPKDVAQARTISSLSYEAAFSLARHGAKVLYAPTVEPVRECGIPFRILNTFNPSDSGTTVQNIKGGSVPVWRGVTSAADGTSGLVTLTLVGEGAVKPEAVGKRLESVLKENGIRVLGSSFEDEGRVQMVRVLAAEERNALAAVHKEFFETLRVAEIMVYVAGFGAVGHDFVDIVRESSSELASRTGKSVRIVGLSDSKRYVINLAGVNPDTLAASGRSAAQGAFFKEVAESASRGAVLVDCTNAEDTGKWYRMLLERGIGVVSSNRRALAGTWSSFVAMKDAARENGVLFAYDTTVGTALPILESISSGANSCDRVERIDALVSCTLNYIISNYNGAKGETLANLLRSAQAAGLTEKDPRLDLGGGDALRKLLILAREAGIPLEAEDVEIEPMLGKEFFGCSIEKFYALLDEAEPDFVALEAELDAQKLHQRFIASVVADPASASGYRASIKMVRVDADSPFFRVNDTENIISISSRYFRVPLVLRGAGEGSRQAAAGILNDIIK